MEVAEEEVTEVAEEEVDMEEEEEEGTEEEEEEEEGTEEEDIMEEVDMIEVRFFNTHLLFCHASFLVQSALLGWFGGLASL